MPLDWAYLEDWCRRLTASFKDVYVFTVPLYLPRQEADGKWRVVSRYNNNRKATLWTFIFADSRGYWLPAQCVCADPFRESDFNK